MDTKGTVICFGDSNTYGYEPVYGGRLRAEQRWVNILEKESGWRTVNAGMNGRQIPHTDYEKQEVFRLLDAAEAGEYGDGPVLFWILLGTNDIQMNYGYTAERVAERMKMLLLDMLWHDAVASGKVQIRVLGPARTEAGPWSDERQVAELARVGRLEKLICRELGVDFTDLGGLDIDLAEDGDHFSPAGHREAADFLLGLLS